MKNNKQQTAVEWLVEKMLNQDWYTYKSLKFIEQAKEMEKEQIIEAFKHGELPPLFVNFDAEQYYNETYGGNK